MSVEYLKNVECLPNDCQTSDKSSDNLLLPPQGHVCHIMELRMLLVPQCVYRESALVLVSLDRSLR